MGTEDGIELELPTESSEWVVFNVDQIGSSRYKSIFYISLMFMMMLFSGYYRVNYDEDNWKLIIDQLRKDHHAIAALNRAQLIDDSLTIARTGALSYSIAFDVSTYLRAERDFAPWISALEAFDYLDRMLYRTSSKDHLRVISFTYFKM